MPVPAIFVLNGPPGAGKTTVSRALLKCFERGFHVEVDAIREMVVQGISNPVPTWTEETSRQFRLSEQAAADLAARYFDADFAVAVDHLHSLEAIKERILAPLAPRRVIPIVLVPDLEENLARNRDRTTKNFDTSFLEDTIRGTQAEMFHPSRRQPDWHWIDSSHESVEQTVNQILGLIHQA